MEQIGALARRSWKMQLEIDGHLEDGGGHFREKEPPFS